MIDQATISQYSMLWIPFLTVVVNCHLHIYLNVQDLDTFWPCYFVDGLLTATNMCFCTKTTVKPIAERHMKAQVYLTDMALTAASVTFNQV